MASDAPPPPIGGPVADTRVGVFWLIAPPNAPTPAWLAHICPAELVEPYGDCLTCPHGHHDLWEAWRRGDPDNATSGPHAASGLNDDARAIVRGTEYDDWPRGRVVREPDRSVVYADAQLMTPERRERVRALFALDADATVFRRDAHYARAQQVM